ncbi:EAL domain-containing protein [Almyronema epifaneia]|uniref:EAL domain-containing protein n=1 Tax=Almyronema epifaneia S1 TaxID=2991925 RepID=A0ABW6IDR6_9CYAN
MQEDKQSLHFLILEEQQDQRVVYLEKCVYSIGRSSKNSIVFSAKSISRYHAHLYRVKQNQDNTYIFRIVDGDLQGKRSTNGLTVNGQPCFSKTLEHGDVIQLSQKTCIRYYQFQNIYDFHLLSASPLGQVELSLSTEKDLASSNSVNSRLDKLSKTELYQIASFLELIPTPVIELSSTGNISYCNLAARHKFPNLLEQKLKHPILENLESIFQKTQSSTLFREIRVGDRVFEQFACLMAETHLIRSYTFDVTERYQTNLKLCHSQAKEQALLTAIPDLIVDLDPQGNILRVKPAKDPQLAILSEAHVGRNIVEVLPAAIAQQLLTGIRQTLTSQETYTFDCEWTAETEQSLYCEVRLVWNSAQKVLAIVRNITKRKTFEQQLRHEALHDHLTGLLNRQSFLERVDHVIKLSKRRKSYLFAVLFIDLDRFKVVNDSLGHFVGDQLLIAIANRLTTCLRAGDTVARLGGDEFTVLLEDLTTIQEATDVAERILQSMTTPVLISGREIFVSASVGIAASTSNYDKPDQLLRDADTAMYQAKAQGRACYEQFNQNMHEQMVGLLQLDNDLRRAIERQEFQLYYQPIVALQEGTIVGFEALIRWLHPQQGLVAPQTFIHLAEETGLILPIGEWMLFEACRQLCQWQQGLPQAKDLTMSVNLSGKQFSNPHLAKQIERALHQASLTPERLKLEITESVIMENTQLSKDTLSVLRDLGLQICIDDFGTGYSSLSYLHRFPINALKVDRSFIGVMDANDENSGLAITQTITTLAHRLGVDVVAEGIETAKQFDLVKTFRCKYGQGYFFSKPLPPQQAQSLLAEAPRW